MSRKPEKTSQTSVRRHLFLSAGVFIILVLGTLAVVAHLVFQDLSRQVVTRNLLSGLSELKQKWSEQAEAGTEVGLATPAPAPSSIPDLDHQLPVPSPPVAPEPSPPRFRAVVRGLREIATIRDSGGHVVGQQWRTRLVWTMEPIHERENPPYDRPVEEEWNLGDKKQRVVTIHEPVDPTGRTIAEVGIPVEQVEKSLRPIRHALITKTLIGAGITLLILGIAFFYVLRLLQRTSRLEAEAQMAERRSQVASLAREMAHEIRNPLNAMSMNLEMLEEELSGGREGGGSEVAVFLHGIKGEIRRLKDLAENFLSYARPVQLTLDGRDLNRFLEEVCSFLQPEADARRIHLIRDLDPVLPSVDFDSAQLRQAVLNIVNNAQQVVPEGGSIQVRTRVSNTGEIRISITDSGPGMSADVMSRIFQPFYSHRQGGTGLGLPIARRAVEAHGGRIEVESRPGRGSTFHIFLPRRQDGARRAGEGKAAAWSPVAEGADGLRQAR